MDPLNTFTIILGFFITLFSIPIWINRAKKAGLVGRDMHKVDGVNVATVGGISVVFGAVISLLFHIAVKTFYFRTGESIVESFSILTSILIIGGVGLMDDLLGWKIGLTKKTRLILLLFSAIPLMVINAGESSIMGIELGILYPLIIIPFGIVGAASTYNFLAGYNGLETSQGIIILSSLGIVTYMQNSRNLSLICFIIVSCLLAFYIFNKSPAKVFPGNILTYFIGSLIAIVAILGNIEMIAVFFFIPYILETILKSRGGLKKESFAKLNHDGSLELPYEKIYGLEHFAIYLLKKIKPSKKVYEHEVVWCINGFQIIVILIGFLVFF